jgi:hypothetical protein
MVDHQPGGIAACVPSVQAHLIDPVAIAGLRRSDAYPAAVSRLMAGCHGRCEIRALVGGIVKKVTRLLLLVNAGGAAVALILDRCGPAR